MNREQRRKAASNKGKESQRMFTQGNNFPSDMLSYALSLHRSGQVAQARDVYEKILESEPKNPKVLNALGLLKAQMGDDVGAIRLISAAVSIEPNSWLSK